MTSGHVGEVLRLFDVKAEDWSAKYAPDGPLASRLGRLSAAVSWYARAGDRILDLGCGTGELARALATGGLRVTGCDISPQMLIRATNYGASRSGTSPCGPTRPEWMRLEPDWRSLPFASGTFDVIVISSVLEYVAEPVAVLRECARVLRSGGVLLYTVPDLRHPVRWAEWCAQPLARMTGEPAGPGHRSRPAGPGHRSRWQGYRAYLRASRQRHRARWWLAASGSAGLQPVPYQADGARSAIRLLAFCTSTRGRNA